MLRRIGYPFGRAICSLVALCHVPVILPMVVFPLYVMFRPIFIRGDVRPDDIATCATHSNHRYVTHPGAVYEAINLDVCHPPTLAFPSRLPAPTSLSHPEHLVGADQ